MKSFFAISIAVVYGLMVRILFGFLSGFMEIMSLAFMLVLPFAIGFITIISLPKEKAKTDSAAFFIPWITSFVILIVTILSDIEGTICWIMIFPFFAIFAGIGGVIAHHIRKRKVENTDLNKYEDWKKPDTLNASLIMLFPLFLGMIEGERTLTRKDYTITREVIIPASPTEIWNALANINEIKTSETHMSLSSLLGFPHHIRTIADTMAIGGKRIAYYEKGLYFNETIAQYQPQKLMVLDIKTDPTKIPSTVMDEHIIIGGKHVDILQDVYQLQPLPDGTCRLTLSSHFFINTPFNWYAGIWADYLMNDILKEELDLIKTRSVAKAKK